MDWADQALKRARAIFYLHVAGAKVPEHPGIVCVPLPSYAGIAEFLQQIEVKPWRPAGERPRRRRRAAFGRHPGMDRDRAASGRQNPAAVRARQYMSIYRDQVELLLTGAVTPDARARAWTDRLLTTWQALENAE